MRDIEKLSDYRRYHRRHETDERVSALLGLDPEVEVSIWVLESGEEYFVGVSPGMDCQGTDVFGDGLDFPEPEGDVKG